MPADWQPGTELGPRLRRVREERGLSVRELARRVGCSASLVSQIERGLSAPSVGMLYGLATELGASLDFLFGVTPPRVTAHEARAPAVPPHEARDRAAAPRPRAGRMALTGHGVVQRAVSRRAIDLASGVRWERLTPAADERVDFLEVIYEPGGHSTDTRRPLRHDGHEYGLVTCGRLRANVGFESYQLGPGDSIAFDSATPHEYWNTSADRVHAVWVVVHAEPGRA
jgi:transcriptional regulator with XRE-family HTH domain